EPELDSPAEIPAHGARLAPTRPRRRAKFASVWRLVSALLPLSLLPASARADVTSIPRPASAAAVDPARLHVLMINGGGRPEDNFRSHVLHLEELLALLGKAGVRRDRIAVLASDGDHPDPDVATRGQDPRGF